MVCVEVSVNDTHDWLAGYITEFVHDFPETYPRPEFKGLCASSVVIVVVIIVVVIIVVVIIFINIINSSSSIYHHHHQFIITIINS